jgi:hypothetical protein
MALLDERSCICTKSELDIFSVNPTQTSIDSGSVVEFFPLAPLDAGPVIDFYVPGGEDYMDLANTYLCLSVKIKKQDGGNIEADSKVAPANLIMHSLFSQVDVSLNDKLVSTSSGTYAYRAFYETLLNYSKSTKETQLTASGWYKDTAGQMDDYNANEGLKKRAKLLEKSKTLDLIGKLHSDMFHQEKLILGGVSMRLKLTRNKDSFVLQSSEDGAAYCIKVVKAVLRVRKCRVSSAVALAHAHVLEKANAKYSINRVEVKSFSIPSQSLDVTQENIFMGQLPTRVIIGLLDNDAYNGSYKKNPFNFKNYNLTKISLQLDAQEQPAKPIYCNFEEGATIDGYMSLFVGTGKAFRDADIDLTRDEYADGYTLYAFDLTPDLASDSDHYSLLKSGSVRLKLTFSTALPNTINAVVYAEFQNVLEIDRNRNVFYDFNA